jgi:Na+/H+-translocating membrane pyrophosphatase
MSVGMMLISVELLFMLASCSSSRGTYAGACFIGFAIGESLGAAALRIAGGIFTKIADIGSDLMKIVFKIKEDDARNPGVIADCTGDNAGDSVGPTADGFETYGVTGVALIVVHRPRGGERAAAGAAARLDLHDARDDGHRLGGVVSRTSSTTRARYATARRRCTSRRRSRSSCG